MSRDRLEDGGFPPRRIGEERVSVSHRIHFRSSTHPSAYKMDKSLLFSAVKRWAFESSLLHLVPKLRIHGAVPPLPLTYLFREAQRRFRCCFRVVSYASLM
jgi:hypothetical protein